MVLIAIDRSSEVPLHEQVAAAVKREIAAGTVAVGEKLPTAGDVAAALDINKHTVLRAYQSLRDEGTIELRRGRGAVVICEVDEQEQLKTLMEQAWREASRLGLSIGEAERVLRQCAVTHTASGGVHGSR